MLEQMNTEYANGETVRGIAVKHGVNPSSLLRHFKHAGIAKIEPEPIAAVNSIDSLSELSKRADKLFKQAQQSGKQETALRCLKEMRELVSLSAKLTGELRTGTTINILALPEWTAARRIILKAIDPYPDAKRAMIKALGAVPMIGSGE
jgi:transposase-like protein